MLLSYVPILLTRQLLLSDLHIALFDTEYHAPQSETTGATALPHENCSQHLVNKLKEFDVRVVAHYIRIVVVSHFIESVSCFSSFHPPHPTRKACLSSFSLRLRRPLRDRYGTHRLPFLAVRSYAITHLWKTPRPSELHLSLHWFSTFYRLYQEWANGTAILHRRSTSTLSASHDVILMT